MLQITVSKRELFDESNNMFIQIPETQLKLEHSLLSISKWESKWCKPFLRVNDDDKLTNIEFVDYIRCMTLNDVPKDVYNALTYSNFNDIKNYMNSPMTASTVHDTRSNNPYKREVVTSELIYYWMTVYQIPFECEKWHINRLIMLIKICNAKNNPTKMSKRDIYAQNRQLNAARRKALHTKG